MDNAKYAKANDTDSRVKKDTTSSSIAEANNVATQENLMDAATSLNVVVSRLHRRLHSFDEEDIERLSVLLPNDWNKIELGGQQTLTQQAGLLHEQTRQIRILATALQQYMDFVFAE